MIFRSLTFPKFLGEPEGREVGGRNEDRVCLQTRPPAPVTRVDSERQVFIRSDGFEQTQRLIQSYNETLNCTPLHPLGARELERVQLKRTRTRRAVAAGRRARLALSAAARVLQEHAEESVGIASRLTGELLVDDLPARQTPTYPPKPRHMLELHRSPSLYATVTVLLWILCSALPGSCRPLRYQSFRPI